MNTKQLFKSWQIVSRLISHTFSHQESWLSGFETQFGEIISEGLFLYSHFSLMYFFNSITLFKEPKYGKKIQS